MKKIRVLKLRGEVPMMYSRTTIYNICIFLNAVVDTVNYLAEELEKTQEELKKMQKEREQK